MHGSYDQWVKDGSKTTVEQARERVSEILASHESVPLPDDVLAELGKIKKRADAAS